MIDWDKIAGSHVIKIFQKICYKWLGVDIQFYDEYSNCKSANIPLQNPLCHLIHSKSNGANHCFQNYKKCLKVFNKSKRPFSYKCYAGLYGVAVPIFANERYVGAMVGSGIQLSGAKDPRQKTEIIRKLSKLGFDKALVEQCYNKLKMVNSRSEEHLLDFMEIVAEDVMGFYDEMLQEEGKINARQTLFLERAYNKKYRGIIGTSPAMGKIFNILELIEDSEGSVLIEGESGTGKELLAAAIHYNSPRKDKVFVIQNCSTFSDTLLSSELFGHEKGSFTGAISDKKGLFEIADGGTLFLDELGDMNIEVQAKLLRVLENGTFYRVGGTEQKKVDVRIIASSNKGLKKQIEKGLFREDLFFRINTIYINMPPLRERKEDIIPLVNYFLESYAKIHHVEKKVISQDIIGLLMVCKWPGNVRELKNVIERLSILSGKNKKIEPDHVPMEIITASYPEPCAGDRKNGAKLRNALESLEKELIKDELRKAKWNKSVAARELGISRASLNIKIKQFSIQPDINLI